MSRVDLTRAAEADLIGIWNHVADASVIQADRLLARFAAKFSHLADHPGLGRLPLGEIWLLLPANR